MAKRGRRPGKQPAIVRDKIFTLMDYDSEPARQIMRLDITSQKDIPYWQDFLNRETEKSFRFINADGTSCSVIKEQRKFYGGKLFDVWYAHKRLDKKLRRKYIGVSKNVTYDKLKTIAFELSQRELL